MLYDQFKNKTMKYRTDESILQCFMNQSNWMKGTYKNKTPIGILWHDTAAGNPYISRYVQPDDDAPHKDELIEILGPNKYGNDWNHSNRDAGVNAFIGKLADGSVTTVQVGPWTAMPWGCGGGDKGSCNGYIKNGDKAQWKDKFWIQWEICDDGYKDNKGSELYFEAVYEESCHLTAFLCRKYNLDPLGTVDFYGNILPVITCHREAHKYKFGSDHSDTYKWFNAYDYPSNMEGVRQDVAALIKATEEEEKFLATRYYIAVMGSTARIADGYPDASSAVQKCDELGYGYVVIDAKTGDEVYAAPYIPKPTFENTHYVLNEMQTWVALSEDLAKQANCKQEVGLGIAAMISAATCFSTTACLKPKETKIFCDMDYTYAVDSGYEENFVTNKTAYGMLLWSSEEEKGELLTRSILSCKSVADYDVQKEVLYSNLLGDYEETIKILNEHADMEDTVNILGPMMLPEVIIKSQEYQERAKAVLSKLRKAFLEEEIVPATDEDPEIIPGPIEDKPEDPIVPEVPEQHQSPNLEPIENPPEENITPVEKEPGNEDFQETTEPRQKDGIWEAILEFFKTIFAIFLKRR